MLKKSITKANRFTWSFAALCLVTLVAGLILAATWYQYQLNADAVSYFSIAQKYAHGEFRDAINGYWGPLLSWLLVPFVWAGTSATIAAKMLAVLSAVGILVSIYSYLGQLKVAAYVRFVTCAAIAPILLAWALVGPITPDLLFALLTLQVVRALDVFMTKPSTQHAVWLGVSGAFLYFTKGVGFYLFLAVVGFVALWQWRTHSQALRQVASRYAPILMVFAAVVLPFVTLISLKYDHFAITTGAEYNYSVVGPNLQWHQALSVDIYTPPNATAPSAWEDPTTIAPLLPTWNVFDSWTTFHYFVANIMTRNMVTLLTATSTFDPLMSTGILLAVVGAASLFTWRRQARLFVLVGGVMIAGYALIALETRYIWALWLFGALSVALFVQTLLRAKVLGTRHIVLVGGMAIALSSLSTIHLFNTTAYEDRASYTAAKEIGAVIPAHSHIVTDNFNFATFACYHASLQCYGTLKAPTAAEAPAYVQRLKSMGITYYVTYDKESATQAQLQTFLGSYFEKTLTSSGGVVYRLK